MSLNLLYIFPRENYSSGNLSPRSAMRKEEYAEYLNHPLWIAKREEVFRRYGRRCAKCGSEKFLHVHHKTYTPGKMPWEYPIENFEVLCEEHHDTTHSFEYTPKHCEGCGKVIEGLDAKLQTEKSPGAAGDRSVIGRLEEERKRAIAEKERAEKTLAELEKLRQADSQRMQSQLSSLKVMVVALAVVIVGGLIVGLVYFKNSRPQPQISVPRKFEYQCSV